MALIVITSDADFVYVEFNDSASEWNDAKISRVLVRAVCKLVDDIGVEVIWTDSKSFILKWEYVDSVNGVSVTSNIELRDKLRLLMK